MELMQTNYHGDDVGVDDHASSNRATDQVAGT